MRIALNGAGAVIDDRLIPLTRSEQTLLAWLIAHAGEPQPREVLLAEVWGYRPGVASRAVDMAIGRLRAKLEDDPRHPKRILTVRGGGWVFVPSADEAPLFGREVEQAAIERWLDGDGRALLVIGPPGIGKSRLVEVALGGRAARIDLSGADPAAACKLLEGSVGLTWLDDADPVLDTIRSLLLAPTRRLVITCRYPVELPGADYLSVGPLAPGAARAGWRGWSERRFPHLAGAEPEPCGGNPLRMRLALWARGGAELPGGRHASWTDALAWGIASLDLPLREALARLASVAAPLDAEYAGIVLGRDDPGPVLARLRARYLVVDPDQVVIPPEVRSAIAPDPRGIEALRGFVADRAQRFLRTPPDDRRTDEIAGRWEAWVQAAEACTDPVDLAAIAIALDTHTEEIGPRRDAERLLERALEADPPLKHRLLLVGRKVFAAFRTNRITDALIAELDDAVARARSADRDALGQALVLWFRALYIALWQGDLRGTERGAQRLARTADEARLPYPGSLARVALAQALGAQGRFDEALAQSRAAVALQTDLQWEVAQIHALALADAGRCGEAIEWSGELRSRSRGGIDALVDASSEALAAFVEIVSILDGAPDGFDLQAVRQRCRRMADARARMSELGDGRVDLVDVLLAAAWGAAEQPERALPLLGPFGSACEATPLLAMYVRPVLARTRAALGLPPGDLPPPVPGSDPALEAIVRGERPEGLPLGVVARVLRG